MGLRIRTNIASEIVQNNLRSISIDSQDSLAKLSSGKRITKSSDDVAGLAIARNIEAQTKGLRVATRNANAGISLIQTAEGGLNETANILTRLRELTVQAATDTIGHVERGFLDREYKQLSTEIDRIAASTVFNGSNLLDGSGGEKDFQVGTFEGEQNKITFDSSQIDSTASAIGISSTSVETKSNALGSMSEIDDAIEIISGQRADLGSIQSRLGSTIANLEAQTLNQESARSNIEDVDVAKETARLASTNVLSNAGVAALAQANRIPNTALKLIG